MRLGCLIQSLILSEILTPIFELVGDLVWLRDWIPKRGELKVIGIYTQYMETILDSTFNFRLGEGGA